MNAARALKRDQVRQVDQLAVEQYAMSSLVLMENAGRGCTDVLCQLGIRGPVVICCGVGNNAGDGLVIARHLDLRGYSVRIVLCSDPDRLGGDAAANWEIVRRAELPSYQLTEGDVAQQLKPHLDGAEWIVDALLGTGAKGEPRPPLDQVIDVVNEQQARRLAVDVPSGLDCDSGQPAGHTFRADHTCTFVAAKPGLLAPSAQPLVGQLHVLDIGVPGKLLDQFGLRPG